MILTVNSHCFHPASAQNDSSLFRISLLKAQKSLFQDVSYAIYLGHCQIKMRSMIFDVYAFSLLAIPIFLDPMEKLNYFCRIQVLKTHRSRSQCYVALRDFNFLISWNFDFTTKFWIFLLTRSSAWSICSGERPCCYTDHVWLIWC